MASKYSVFVDMSDRATDAGVVFITGATGVAGVTLGVFSKCL
jgi:hypothetical protein